jgi:DNA-binding transcriptional LysR family regulator
MRAHARFSKFILLDLPIIVHNQISDTYPTSGLAEVIVLLHSLKVFLSVANEKSFSRAAEKMLRTQPAISLAVQRLEAELDEKLIDRSAKELLLTDAGKVVLEFARRFENLEGDMYNALAELRDNSSGRLTIGANESTSLYLLSHIEQYRSQYPKVKIQVRRSLSSKIPTQLIDGDLELGLISFDPGDERLVSTVIYTDRLVFVVSPNHRLASRPDVSISELGMETFIAHNVLSPYREIVLREFQRHRVALNMDVEMPTVETIRRLVQLNEGVAFLPKMCVELELASGALKEVRVQELNVERNIRLVYPARRALSHAAKAFLDLVDKDAAATVPLQNQHILG